VGQLCHERPLGIPPAGACHKKPRHSEREITLAPPNSRSIGLCKGKLNYTTVALRPRVWTVPGRTRQGNVVGGRVCGSTLGLLVAGPLTYYLISTRVLRTRVTLVQYYFEGTLRSQKFNFSKLTYLYTYTGNQANHIRRMNCGEPLGPRTDIGLE
jgi:hypothetical protein